jgi:predicted nucleic acid-binding protein
MPAFSSPPTEMIVSFWVKHIDRLARGIVPLVPAPVVAQVSRSSRQAQLRRFLAGCEVVPLGEADAHEAGRLLGISKTTDVVDAVVVATALRHNAVILTGDPEDMARRVRAADRDLGVAAV